MKVRKGIKEFILSCIKFNLVAKLGAVQCKVLEEDTEDTCIFPVSSWLNGFFSVRDVTSTCFLPVSVTNLICYILDPSYSAKNRHAH